LKYLIIGFFLIVNLLSYFLVGYDKYKAKRKGWRVAEKNLFAMALIGGAIGIFWGIRIFRHKTKHASFLYGIPFLVLVNLLIYIYLFKNV
jgi:hypothetical protein